MSECRGADCTHPQCVSDRRTTRSLSVIREEFALAAMRLNRAHNRAERRAAARTGRRLGR